MRADQQLSVEMGGDYFQIACKDVGVIADLRSRLAPWIVEGTALPGFKINAPEPGNRLWVLLGSDGAVLARSTSSNAILRSLLRHLSALAAPQSAATQRVTTIAFASSNGVLLADPSLLRAQPLIERRLGRSKLAVVDSPFLELPEKPGTHLSGIAALAPSTNESDEAHLHPASLSGPITGMLWRSSSDPADVTRGQVAHALASVARTGAREERIDFGIAWSDSLVVELVDPAEAGSVLAAAETLLGPHSST